MDSEWDNPEWMEKIAYGGRKIQGGKEDMHLGGYNWDVFFENLCVLLFGIGWEVENSSSNCLEESITSEKNLWRYIHARSLDDTPLLPYKKFFLDPRIG